MQEQMGDLFVALSMEGAEIHRAEKVEAEKSNEWLGRVATLASAAESSLPVPQQAERAIKTLRADIESIDDPNQRHAFADLFNNVVLGYNKICPNTALQPIELKVIILETNDLGGIRPTAPDVPEAKPLKANQPTKSDKRTMGGRVVRWLRGSRIGRLARAIAAIFARIFPGGRSKRPTASQRELINQMAEKRAKTPWKAAVVPIVEGKTSEVDSTKAEVDPKEKPPRETTPYTPILEDFVEVVFSKAVRPNMNKVLELFGIPEDLEKRKNDEKLHEKVLERFTMIKSLAGTLFKYSDQLSILIEGVRGTAGDSEQSFVTIIRKYLNEVMQPSQLKQILSKAEVDPKASNLVIAYLYGEPPGGVLFEGSLKEFVQAKHADYDALESEFEKAINAIVSDKLDTLLSTVATLLIDADDVVKTFLDDHTHKIGNLVISQVTERAFALPFEQVVDQNAHRVNEHLGALALVQSLPAQFESAAKSDKKLARNLGRLGEDEAERALNIKRIGFTSYAGCHPEIKQVLEALGEGRPAKRLKDLDAVKQISKDLIAFMFPDTFEERDGTQVRIDGLWSLWEEIEWPPEVKQVFKESLAFVEAFVPENSKGMDERIKALTLGVVQDYAIPAVRGLVEDGVARAVETGLQLVLHRENLDVLVAKTVLPLANELLAVAFLSMVLKTHISEFTDLLNQYVTAEEAQREGVQGQLREKLLAFAKKSGPCNGLSCLGENETAVLNRALEQVEEVLISVWEKGHEPDFHKKIPGIIKAYDQELLAKTKASSPVYGELLKTVLVDLGRFGGEGLWGGAVEGALGYMQDTISEALTTALHDLRRNPGYLKEQLETTLPSVLDKDKIESIVKGESDAEALKVAEKDVEVQFSQTAGLLYDIVTQNMSWPVKWVATGEQYLGGDQKNLQHLLMEKIYKPLTEDPLVFASLLLNIHETTKEVVAAGS